MRILFVALLLLICTGCGTGKLLPINKACYTREEIVQLYLQEAQRIEKGYPFTQDEEVFIIKLNNITLTHFRPENAAEKKAAGNFFRAFRTIEHKLFEKYNFEYIYPSYGSPSYSEELDLMLNLPIQPRGEKDIIVICTK